jgi:hypothetical protein
VFQELLLNFTWWVNRNDADGLNVFQCGFLGLDNVGLFDRSQPLPGGIRLESHGSGRNMRRATPVYMTEATTQAS